MLLAVLYVAVRPILAGVVPHLTIIEFPVALLGAALVVRYVARRQRRQARQREATAETPPLGRRHEQRVRDMPDPEERRVRETLDAWVATGHGREELVRVLSRDAGGREDAALARRLDDALTQAENGNPQKRERALRALLDDLEREAPATTAGPRASRTPRQPPSKPSGA